MGDLLKLCGLIDQGATAGIQIAGDKLKKDIMEAARKSVEFFYDSYTPSVPWNGQVYQRQYGLRSSYLNMDIGGGLTRTVGSNFMGGLMGGSHRADNSWLFGITWGEGIHGNPAWASTVHTTPPRQFMDKMFAGIKSKAQGVLYKGIAQGMHSVGL